MTENIIKNSNSSGKRVSIVRKIYLSDSTSKEKTFQYDESLPSLPVPELKETIEK